MAGILILFIISILGLVAMFWFKLHELNNGKTLYPDHYRERADRLVKKGVSKAATTAHQIEQIPVRDLTAKAVGTVAKGVGTGVSHVYKKAKNSDNKVANFIKGKKVLVRKEKRSDFLNTIEEHKRANGGGEIEG